ADSGARPWHIFGPRRPERQSHSPVHEFHSRKARIMQPSGGTRIDFEKIGHAAVVSELNVEYAVQLKVARKPLDDLLDRGIVFKQLASLGALRLAANDAANE